MPDQRKFVFAVGIMRLQRVTVHASSIEEAWMKARVELDRCALEREEEPPVSWDLELVL